MTDSCKNNVSEFVWNLFNHLYHYANENVSEKLLSLICIASILLVKKLFSLWKILQLLKP